MKGRKEGLGKEQELGRLVESSEDPEKELGEQPCSMGRMWGQGHVTSNWEGDRSAPSSLQVRNEPYILC